MAPAGTPDQFNVKPSPHFSWKKDLIMIRITYTNPRFIVGKLPIFGKIVAICDGLTPNQFASVAAYCTLPVVGTHRPFVPESSGPFKASVGNVPYICPPFTAPPITM